MLKQQAGVEACMYVKNGMKVGLGHWIHGKTHSD